MAPLLVISHRKRPTKRWERRVGLVRNAGHYPSPILEERPGTDVIIKNNRRVLATRLALGKVEGRPRRCLWWVIDPRYVKP
jgi:hypothetical protein